MTLNDLTHKTAQTTGNSLKQTKQIIDEFLDHLADAVRNLETIQIKGICTFKPKLLPKRMGFNPQTRKKEMFPECKTITITPSAQFRKRLNGKLDK